MQTGKKLCAILLVLCMLVGVLPASVLAAGTDTQVVGQQLMLGDDLCLHLYTNVSEALANPVATISVNGVAAATYTIGNMAAEEDGSYDLSVHVGAPQMADTINLRITDGDQEILNKDYSIQAYAQYLLDNNYTNETKALVKNLLNYGAKAQLHFDHNVGNLANAGNEIEVENTIAAEAPAVEVEGSVPGIYHYGTSMVFQSKIAMRYYFLATSVEGYTFTVDGKELEPQKKDNKFYVEVANINPQDMGKDMTVAVTDGTDTLSFTYSPDAYISRMYNKSTTGETLKNLLVAANAYFEAAEVFTGVAENRTGALSFGYRYGTASLIQVNTNLPSDTPCANFTADQNGCSIDQSANSVQWFGWVGMDNVDGTIVLTFHFNNAFTADQTYTLPKGAVFGFTDGSKYTLDKDYTFYFDGSGWSMLAAEPAITLQYRYGTAKLIQYNTNLPVEAMGADFLADGNGCVLTQSGDQQVGYISMANADGTVVLTFNFNAAFEEGGSYTLAAGSVFGFENGSKYQLNEDITLYWDGSSWGAEPAATEPTLEPISFGYRYGTNNLIQMNTNLPASTPCVNFTADQNGCSIDQSANSVQWFGWVGMDNADGVIVLTFHFNNAFTAGQSYTLPAGAIFGFTDGNKYALDDTYTFTFDGASWSMEGGAEVEPPVTEPDYDPISFGYRYGTASLIQVNTNLPATTPIKDFLTGDNDCVIDESGNQYKNVAWIGMANADGTIVLTFNFNGTFAAGQTYTLPAGAIFGFTDGNKYALDDTYTFTFDGTSWSMEGGVAVEPEEKNINLTYRYGTDSLIQFNTDLPASTPCANFLASDNGCNLTQNVQAGWIGMENVDGVIVLTFHFNSAFAYGDNYSLAAGSVFGFTDGSSYTMPGDVNLYWDGAAWTAQEPTKEINLTYRYGTDSLIQFNTDLPASTPIQNFLASDNGCSLTQNVQVGWIGMENADGVIVLTFHFNSAFAFGDNYSLAAGSVFGFTDGSSYVLTKTSNLYWDNSAWGETVPEVKDVLDESNFTGGKEFISFADLPVDSRDPAKIEEYKGLGLNTSVLTEDYTGAQGPDELYRVSMETANAPSDSLTFSYRYGTASLIQVNTNLPSDTPCVNFTVGDNDCDIDQTGNTVQWVGWIGMENVDGVIVLTFHFNNAFTAGQSYVLPKDALFGFTDGNMYLLDGDYTFTFDGTNWSMSSSTLQLSLSAGAAKYMQLKTNIPTGLTYGDFLMKDAAENGHNVILETTEGAQAVGWFSYSELSGAVYLTFNFNGFHKPGTQYILKKGTSLKAGDNVYVTDRDYILTVHNDYLTSLENLDEAGLQVWIRNHHNKADYFTADMTNALLLYKDVIDGFYMVDEAFQTNALLTAAGQEDVSSDFDSMTVVRDWFNANFAEKYYHSNHVPITSYDHYTAVNGSTLSAMDVNGYKAFLEEYKATYNDQLTGASGASVSFDNYPFIHAQGTYKYGTLNLLSKFESGIQSTYLLNCLLAAQVAAEDDFGLCIQTFEASDLTYKVSRDIVSAAEVSLQLYTGMAMGADLFEYFAYNSNGEFNTIMNQDGSKRIYDIVAEGNQALCFADVVNTFSWNGIMTSAGSANSHNSVGFGYVADMVLSDSNNGVLSSVASTDDAIVGCFTKDTLNGYMVVNFNDPAAVTGDNTVTLNFAGCTRARVYANVNGELTSQLVDLTNGVYTAILAPGSACFVIPA